MRTGGGSSEQPTEIPVHSSNGSGEEPKKKTKSEGKRRRETREKRSSKITEDGKC